MQDALSTSLSALETLEAKVLIFLAQVCFCKKPGLHAGTSLVDVREFAF